MYSLTYRLLRVVGSPFINLDYKFKVHEDITLYRYACKNRMPLLYLKALNRAWGIGSLGNEYVKLKRKFEKIEEAISQFSDKLNSWGVEHAFFKSIKPYQEVTVDIDILVFGSEYSNVIRKMRDAGYKFLARGPLSATFRNSKSGVDFDVYDEVGVSRIVYLDKDVLANFVEYRKLSNGAIVCSLSPEADLLAVIAHSVLKEQMYVLAEYYTTLYYLANMRSETLNSFLYLADKCEVQSAVKAHLGITAMLHKEAYGKLPILLTELIDKLGVNYLELSCAAKMDFLMPYKYHTATILKAFLEKIKEEKARRSFVSQTLNMLNPRFTSHFVSKVFYHVRRKTY